MGVEAAIVASVASAGIGAYTAIQSGKYAQAAAEAETRQYEEERRMAVLQAQEEANARNRELLRTQSENLALAAAKMGVDPNESASFLALKESNIQEAERDVGAIRLMGAAQAEKFKLSAWNAKMSGKAAKTASYGQAASSLLGGYKDYKYLSS
jgi:hypothetical protein